MDEQKAFMVRVSGFSGFFSLDSIDDVKWIMELFAEDGLPSRAFKRNELGQYEPYAYCAMNEEE